MASTDDGLAMFKRKKQATTGPNRIDTLVGAGTRIIGDVHFSGGLHVDGHVKGNVDAPPASSSTLSVSDAGVIEGSVAVPNVVLNGVVKGDIMANGRVELGAHARVSGNVYYGLIEMAMGAAINGKLIHEPRKGEATPGVAPVQATATPKPGGEKTAVKKS
jgi:cytoskeletal protein CcmA (bactofilin family)